MARMIDEPKFVTNGVLAVTLDPGRVGELSVRFKRPTPSKSIANGTNSSVAADMQAKEGRYFSAKQIKRRFDDLEKGKVFDYNNFYNGVYAANSHPDLIVNADLKLRSEIEDDLRLRYVDLGLEVEESLPLHLVLDFSNYGTEASDNWETGITLQHLNLTKHDDVLTFNAQSAIDASLYSVAGSYYYPHYWRKGGAMTLYGGYSDLDVDEVVPSIDVEGMGWFAGLQYSERLIDTGKHRFTLALGKVHRYVEDELIVEDISTQTRGVDLAPFSLSAIYASKSPDVISGRNYATLELLHNIGDFLGSSDDEEIQRLRRDASADYSIARLQLARIQTFGGRHSEDGSVGGKWSLFLRAVGQFADGSLVPAEQFGIGGANTVRGYIEREFLGDHGVYANVELRTPMLLGFLSKPFASEKYRSERRFNPLDRIQFVVFFDIGSIKIEDALPGEDDTQNIYSAGAGLRLAFTENAQLKFDWGVPLEETPESDQPGMGHVNLQIQF